MKADETWFFMKLMTGCDDLWLTDVEALQHGAASFCTEKKYNRPANDKAGEVRVYLRSRKQICWTNVERRYINFVRVPHANLKG